MRKTVLENENGSERINLRHPKQDIKSYVMENGEEL
jgi:hypothetical protein